MLIEALIERDESAVIARFGLPPQEADLPAVRAMLDDEVRREREDDDESDTLVIKALCVVLFANGNVEDTLAIWHAKRASFDAGCSIDVQLLCGAGFDTTCRYLRESEDADARDALAYVHECDAAGDFEGHDAPDGRLAGVLAAFRRYYGLDPGEGS